jgi:signal transduction histidine kinase
MANVSRVRDGISAYSPVPAWAALCCVGAAALAVALGNFINEVAVFGLAPGPLFAGAMGISLSSGVIYTADQLRRSDANPSEAWTVTLSSLAVGVFVEFGYGLTIFVRRVEGRSVAEPAFPLVVMGTVGLLGGAVVGWERVKRRWVTASVVESRDALGFTNSLLRHDVRNALQVIDGRAVLLTDHDDEQVREHATTIRGQVDSLDGLIGEVRSVTNVLTGEFDRTTVDVTEILGAVLDAAEDGHPDLAVERDLPDALLATADDALYPVFRNLVDNAAEHAASGSVRVRVSGQRSGDRVRVRVADDGRGIPESERDRIFEQGISTGDGGYGLYVVKTIVDRLDGSIAVEDSSLGGAAVVVDLLAADRKPQDDAASFLE